LDHLLVRYSSKWLQIGPRLKRVEGKMSKLDTKTETGAAGVAQGTTKPMNGTEFLESLRDDREIWIYGERVKDVTQHPAFRNAARMLARMYDALHAPATKAILTDTTDTGSGGYTHRFYRVDRTVEQLTATRDAIAQWAKISYGWMGRSPDYKASFLGTLGANDEFYAPYQKSALNWYKKAQERVLFLNHAIVNPPVDRNRPPEEVRDVFVHAEKETDSGIIVSGAKVVATGSALTHANFIGFYGGTPLGRPDMAIFAMIPMTTRGVKLICRTSYEMTAEVMGSPFDYPLSSRLDENDAILVLDKYLFPGKTSLSTAISIRRITSTPTRDFCSALPFMAALDWRSSWISWSGCCLRRSKQPGSRMGALPRCKSAKLLPGVTSSGD
jgi:hypothetical protein